jgi:pimeloyl-ACP methyl ester carboxylesterase
VLREAGLGSDVPFVMMGTGVGVRIALEAALAWPDRVSGLVLVGGAAGWRYEWLCRATWLAARLARRAMRDSSLRHAALLSAVTQGMDRVMALGEMSLLVQPEGTDPTEPLETIDAVAASLRALGTEPMIEQAGQIQQPALILCGEDDPRMPAARAHQLARRLPSSWVRIVPRSSSRLAAELPDLVNLEVERFLGANFASAFPHHVRQRLPE